MFKNKFRYTYVFFLLGLFVLLYSCGTTRNTALSRRFQNMTSHYNVFFNGKSAYEKGMEKVKSQYVLDYSIPLPVFIEDIPEARGAGSGSFSKAIAKCDKLVKEHSIKVKPKKGSGDAQFMKRGEWNDWVDNAYLLKGQALYCSGKIEDAQFVFQVLLQKYPYSEVLNEAKLWISRSYFSQDEEEEAIVLLHKLEATKQISKRVKRDIALLWADYHIKHDNYGQAIARLENALKYSMKGPDRRRYRFLLGQLYASMDQKEKAVENYKKVLGLNTPYRMTFYAKIGIYELNQGSRDLDKSKRILGRMLRDEKNEDFQDRIYYALGNIYWEKQESSIAIDYYKKSVTYSEANPTQRVESSLRLADIFFDVKKYRESQSYYDTAVTVIPESYPNAIEIKKRAKFLTALTSNLEVIEVQDSLQQLAAIPKDVLDGKIKEWIKVERKRKREEELRKQQEQQDDLDNSFFRNNAQMSMNQNGSQNSSSASGRWYFYNPSTVATGKANFRQIWGKRVLSDNWRRSNKSKIEGDFSSLNGDEEETGEDMDPDKKEKTKVLTPMDAEYYTKDIPRNDSMFVVSNKKICNAAYNAARIYGEDLHDIDASLEMFDLYLRKTSDPQLKLTVLFYAYDIAYKAGRTAEANRYRNRILNDYGDSRIAMYLRDPSSFEQIAEKQRIQDQKYGEALEAMRNGDYNTSLALSSEIMKSPQDTTLIPKVAYIEMVSLGATKGSLTLERLIKDYKVKYPTSPLMERVNKLEALVKEQSLKDFATMVKNGYIHSEIQNKEVADMSSSEFINQKFEKTADTFYYYVLELNAGLPVDLNRLRFDIAHFNIDFFPEDDFDVDIEKLNDHEVMIVVRALSDKDYAKVYFKTITHQRRVFASLNGRKYSNYVITSKNFRTVKEDKSSLEYQKFFIANISPYIGSEVSGETIEDPMLLIKNMKQQKSNPVTSGTFVEVDTDDIVDASKQTTKTAAVTTAVGTNKSNEAVAKNVTQPIASSVTLENELNKGESSVSTVNEEATSEVLQDKEVVEPKEEIAHVDMAEDLFTDREDIQHAIIFMTTKDTRKINKVRQQLMFVHIKDLKQRGYKVQVEDFDSSNTFVVVTGLSNLEKATSYLNQTSELDRFKKSIVPSVEEVMIISDENLRRLLRNKKIDQYRLFYRKNKMPVVK